MYWIVYRIRGDYYEYYNAANNKWYTDPTKASEMVYDEARYIANNSGGDIARA